MFSVKDTLIIAGVVTLGIVVFVGMIADIFS